MSEFQYVSFRAIDHPVSDKNLEYMHRQSSRADITPWSFDNEYHFGSFRGNAVEMLQRGYDFHLHYANFGIRKLLIRLPDGLPDREAAKSYLGKDSVEFLADKQGPGGTLSIEPFLESGELEGLWELGGLVERLIPLRAEILAGDLRPLYLAHLAIACDGNHDPEETTEGPLPAGLGKLTRAQQALAELYGLDDSLLVAASQDSPALAEQDESQNQHAQWIAGLPANLKDRWLSDWLADPHSTARREMLAEFRKIHSGPVWPTTRTNRTIFELRSIAEEIENEAKRKAAESTLRKRTKRFAAMAASPAATLRETEKLATERTTDAYRQIAKLLSELREALAGSKQADLAERQAKELKAKHPTLKMMVAELRREGFLPK